jgi:hypothetical protein
MISGVCPLLVEADIAARRQGRAHMSAISAQRLSGTSRSPGPSSAGLGPFLPVGDRQLLKAQRPVSRFAPELAASECRAVVISAQRSVALDPKLPSATWLTMIGLLDNTFQNYIAARVSLSEECSDSV